MRSKSGLRRSIETVRRVRRELDPEKALIGFCGAPWTVATYMVAGRGTPEQLPARRLALEDPERFQLLIDILVEASARYLLAQLRAGADVVKIFDSWAGVLDEEGFERWCIAPIKAIVERVRAGGADVRGSSRFRVAPARASAFCGGNGRRCGRRRLDDADRPRAANSCQRRWRCRATSIRCASLPADGRSTMASTRFSRR